MKNDKSTTENSSSEGSVHTPVIEVSEPMLASFVVVAYNQEKFIREAIEGAFSQTYSPLEIILSDDCSTDSTFAIMQEMAANYKGPHTVRLNRNERNLGIAGHVNVAFGMAKGEIIVGAAGDDISMPDRTDVVMRYFKNNQKVYSVISESVFIGAKTGYRATRNLGRRASILESVLTPQLPDGCTAAYRKEVITLFPPLDRKVKAEDGPLAFRAALLGENHYIEKGLVKYRVHGQSIMHAHDPKRAVNIAKLHYTAWRQNEKDLRYFLDARHFILSPIYKSFIRYRVLHEAENLRTKIRGTPPSLRLLFDAKLFHLLRLMRAFYFRNWLARRKVQGANFWKSIRAFLRLS